MPKSLLLLVLLTITTPVYAEIIGNCETDETQIVDLEGNWVTWQPSVHAMVRNWYQHGASVLLRPGKDGILLEHCQGKKLRQRDVRACEEVRVMAGATITLDGEFVYEPDDYLKDRCLERHELTDPKWQMPEVAYTFTSLREVYLFGRIKTSWMVVASQTAAPLFAWANPHARVYELRYLGKRFAVFAVAIPNVPDDMLGVWKQYSLRLRYLDIYQTFLAPGRISVIGLPPKSYSDDLGKLRVVQLSQTGKLMFEGGDFSEFTIRNME